MRNRSKNNQQRPADGRDGRAQPVGQQPSGADQAGPTSRRRAAIPAAETPRRKASALVVTGILLAALCAGGGTGALVMHQRYKSKDVALAVNGVTIREDDIFRRMQMVGGATALQQLVDEELLLQYGRQAGFAPSEALVEAEHVKPLGKPGLRNFLGVSSRTPEDDKRALRVGLTRLAMVSKGVTVTEDDIRRFYRANIDPTNPLARYYTPEAAQVAVILTKTEQEANNARGDLDRGVAFATIARNYSRDSSSVDGGMVPVLLRGRSVYSRIPGLEAAVFGMKIGDTLGPARFGNAWWVIRCLDRKPAKTRSLAVVHEECVFGAKMAKGKPDTMRAIAADFQNFCSRAKLDVSWDRYRAALNEEHPSPLQ